MIQSEKFRAEMIEKTLNHTILRDGIRISLYKLKFKKIKTASHQKK